MGWVGMFLLVVGAIVVLVALVGRKAISEADGNPGVTGTVGGVILVLGLIVTAWHSYTPIDAGKVGIEYGPSGSIVGQMNSGGFIAPWDSVRELDTRTQKVVEQNMEVFPNQAINGIEATVTVNYHVAENDVQHLVRTVGFDYESKIIDSRVVNDTKEATVHYAATELVANREAIRRAIATHLGAELRPYSITVDAVQVNDIHLPDSIAVPLANRQAATINAEAAQNKVKQVEAEARQRVAQARGTADANVVEAEGQAKANRAIAQSVSANPDYIAYLRAQALVRLAENPSTKLVPSNVFLNPSDLSGSPSGSKG